MTVFTGRVQENADGTTTLINPDGSVFAHGTSVPMKFKNGRLLPPVLPVEEEN